MPKKIKWLLCDKKPGLKEFRCTNINNHQNCVEKVIDTYLKATNSSTQQKFLALNISSFSKQIRCYNIILLIKLIHKINTGKYVQHSEDIGF